MSGRGLILLILKILLILSIRYWSCHADGLRRILNDSKGNAMNISSRLTMRAAGIAVLALTLPLPALADCVDTRKATAAEAEFHSRALAALIATLPPVPVESE